MRQSMGGEVKLWGDKLHIVLAKCSEITVSYSKAVFFGA